jgi:hypothetical protein
MGKHFDFRGTIRLFTCHRKELSIGVPIQSISLTSSPQVLLCQSVRLRHPRRQRFGVVRVSIGQPDEINAVRRRDFKRRSVVSEWHQNSFCDAPRRLALQMVWLIFAESREPTSGLEPLTTHYECEMGGCRVLQPLALACRIPVSKRNFLHRLAHRCAVLRAG